MGVKQVSLVIVTYNSLPLMVDCLNSVMQYNDIGEGLECIVVDNCSNDQQALFQTIREKYGNAISLIASNENAGYGAGNNVGVRASTAPYVVIMNPDVRLIEPVFKEMLLLFQRSPQLALLTLGYADASCPFFIKPEHYSWFNLLVFKYYVRKRKFDSRKMYLPGSFLMLDKQSFVSAGMFDERIFLYFEEADLSNRLQQLGKKVDRTDGLKVFHLTHNRPINEYLLSIEMNSLVYYLQKFGYNTRNILQQYVQVNYMKYVAASLTGNKHKKLFFKSWIKHLKRKLNEVSH